VVTIGRALHSAGATASGQPVPSQVLWRHYLNAVIEIEVSPGRWANLNGSDALGVLPLPAPIHVITACNPQGRERSEASNRAAAAELAGELWVSGVAMSRALGRSPSGDHSESSVAVSGLSRQEALRLGRRCGQIAIYEVTADSVILVACDAERVEAVERRSTGRTGPHRGSHVPRIRNSTGECASCIPGEAALTRPTKNPRPAPTAS